MKKINLLLIGIVFIYGAGFIFAALFQRSLIYSPDPSFIDPQLAKVDGVSLHDLSEDPSSNLYIWHLPPADAKAPVIVYFNGQGANIAIWTGRWRRIKAAGAGFIALSYPGYGGSSGHPTEETIHNAAQKTLDWALARYDVSRLVVHGFSLGTGPATKLVRNNPGVRALVLEAPYTSVLDRAQEWFPFYPVGWVLRDTYMTKEWIHEVTDPILVIHGDKDRIIGFHHGQAIYGMANNPKKLVRMEDGYHTTATINGLYPLIWDFIGYRPPE